MNIKHSAFNEYTESEFLELLKDICYINGLSEDEHSSCVIHFDKISQHPDGSDLIYYPEDGADDTPEGILKTVKEWRKSQGLPLFKDSK